MGSALLADVLRRCLAASEIAGVRGVVAHAIDEDAARFYEAHGFVRSPLGERVMLMGIEAVGCWVGELADCEGLAWPCSGVKHAV